MKPTNYPTSWWIAIAVCCALAAIVIIWSEQCPAPYAAASTTQPAHANGANSNSKENET